MIFYTKFDKNAKHRDEHIFAYTLLSQALKKHFGITEYTVQKSKEGKPFLAEYPDIHFNISHCSGLAVCGISDVPIGVDAELVRHYNGNTMKIVFSQSERDFVGRSENADHDFFRIWTLKEAFGKYLGKGIFAGISEYSFDISGEIPICEKAGKAVFGQALIEREWIVGVCSEKTENKFEFIPIPF